MDIDCRKAVVFWHIRDPIEGPFNSSVPYCRDVPEVSGALIYLHDAETRQPLGRLIVVQIPVRVSLNWRNFVGCEF